MNINQFYKLSFDHPNSLAHVVNQDLRRDGYNELAQGELSQFKMPIILKQDSGKNWKDILRLTVGLHLISDRVKKALETNNITGYKTFPIIIYDKKGNKVPGYYGLSITGRSGEIDWTKSEIITKRQENNYTKQDADAMKAVYPDWEIPPPKDYQYYKGLHPGLEKWDGSDIFKNESTNYIFLSQKAYDVLKSLKLNNTKYVNLAEYEIWIDTFLKE